MENAKKGLFITFEGADGCGKTTQINLLNKYLQDKNCETIVTLEPGGSDIGKNLRQILLHHEGYVSPRAELFMYLADRAQHVDAVVVKNVEQGKIVLCDRHIDSLVAYQGYARGGDIEKINFLNEIATNGYKPNLTLVFDVDSEIAQTRVGKVKDRLEKEGLEFHKKVRFGYLELAKKYPDRIKVIDANKTIEEVFEQVKKIINEIV
ncbi:MAG: dTMP kinase [Candidatus Gastranaerophilales bacterium]|nr:dTMP kinase [Candidatus Gastranaerophilales bacterium]